MVRKSRFSRKLERESKKNFILSVFGIILVLFLLFKFGVPLLANFALFLSSSKETKTQENSGPNFLPTPVLFSVKSATNSAKLTIRGKTEGKSTVDLYLNGDIIDKTQAEKDGDFFFDINLLNGTNKIYVKSKLEKNTSDASEEISVLFDDSAPLLTIESPSDGQTFSGEQNYANVAGSTEPQVKITVNGFWSILDQNNKFSYRLPLQNGDNDVKIIVEDQAGNKTEKIIKVKYSP